MTILSNVTTSNAGVPVGPRVYSLGGSGVGNTVIAASTRGAGVERVLEAGATYLFRLINEDTSNTSAITSTATWYQGPLSVDL